MCGAIERPKRWLTGEYEMSVATSSKFVSWDFAVAAPDPRGVETSAASQGSVKNVCNLIRSLSSTKGKGMFQSSVTDVELSTTVPASRPAEKKLWKSRRAGAAACVVADGVPVFVVATLCAVFAATLLNFRQQTRSVSSGVHCWAMAPTA